MSEKHKNKKSLKKNSKVTAGLFHITTTFNNIIVTLTDVEGNVLSSCSSGKKNFRGAKKSTPYSAQVVAGAVVKDAITKMSMKTAAIIIRGPGPGRESAIKSILLSDLIITMISDRTPLPHNGVRPKKKRRI